MLPLRKYAQAPPVLPLRKYARAPPVLPLRKFYIEQILRLVRIKLLNHVGTQPVKRIKR